MLLPLGDTPNPPGRPYINYLFIGLNIAVFLGISLPLMLSHPDPNDPLLYDYLRTLGVPGGLPLSEILNQVSAYDLFVFRHGFRPAEPTLTSLFGALFLHGGWMHLIGNMLFLWIFGDNVEFRLGHFGYFLTYLGTGVAATLFFALFVPGSQIPLIGASGAISGVLGCYYLWFPRNRVKTFVFLFPFIFGTYFIPARWVLGFFLLIDNLLPFLISRGSGGGVAHGAHIGGFLAGVGVALSAEKLAARRGRAEAGFHFEPIPEQGPADPAAAIGEALRLEQPSQAAALYLTCSDRPARLAIPADEVLAVGNFFLAQKRYAQALSLFRSFIGERPASDALDAAYLGAGLAMMHQPRGLTSAYHYFLNALDTARTPSVAEAARRQLRAIERLGKGDGGEPSTLND